MGPDSVNNSFGLQIPICLSNSHEAKSFVIRLNPEARFNIPGDTANLAQMQCLVLSNAAK